MIHGVCQRFEHWRCFPHFFLGRREDLSYPNTLGYIGLTIARVECPGFLRWPLYYHELSLYSFARCFHLYNDVDQESEALHFCTPIIRLLADGLHWL